MKKMKLKYFSGRNFLSVRSGLFSVILFFALLQTSVVQCENLLKNSSFEEKTDSQDSVQLPKDWGVSIGSKAKQCKAELSTDTYDGKNSLKFIIDGQKKDVDVWAGQKIKVIPGSELNFTVNAKDTQGRRCFLQFMPLGDDGKALESTYIPFTLTNKWSPLSAKYIVPQNIHNINVFIHMAGCESTEAYFDKCELTLTEDTTLSNQRVILRVNPLLGGSIDSFIDKENSFNYTNLRSPGNAGGMFIDIIPGDIHPGVVSESLYKSEVIVPFKKIKVSHSIKFGELSGLKVSKTYDLFSEDKPSIKISIDLKNEGEKPLSFTYRIQNIINSEDGTFSYPSRDWLTVFNRTPDSIKTINSIIVDDLRTGWSAKKYKKDKTLLFEFDNQAVYKAYNYLAKNLDTMEWYYRKISLKPGEHWQTECSITLVPVEGEFYTGDQACPNV